MRGLRIEQNAKVLSEFWNGKCCVMKGDDTTAFWEVIMFEEKASVVEVAK